MELGASINFISDAGKNALTLVKGNVDVYQKGREADGVKKKHS